MPLVKKKVRIEKKGWVSVWEGKNTHTAGLPATSMIMLTKSFKYSNHKIDS